MTLESFDRPGTDVLTPRRVRPSALARIPAHHDRTRGLNQDLGKRWWRRAVCSVASIATVVSCVGADLAGQAVGAVTGRVVRAATGEPITGARVLVLRTEQRTVTAVGGWYLLTLAAGTYRIRVESAGYAAVEERIEVPPGGTVLTEFEPAAEPFELESVVIPGPDEERTTGTAGGAVAGEVFDLTATDDIGALLRNLLAGVSAGPSGGQVGSGSSVRLRGPTSVTQSAEPLVYIDDVRVATQPVPGAQGTGQAASMLDLIHAEHVARIRVIRGAAASARYGMEAAAGVILIYTKRGRRRE